MQITAQTIKFISIGLVFLSLASCFSEMADTGFIDEEEYSISEFLDQNQDQFSRFRELLIVTQKHSTLNAYNPWGDGFTLFLPEDGAFDHFISTSAKYHSFEQILEDPSFCNSLVMYHLVNKSIGTVEFPFGALPDSTASGDYITITPEIRADTSIYKVNSTATVIIPDIEVNNGMIHGIDKVLDPIVYSSYDWLVENPDYSIISALFEITKLKDTMGIYVTLPDGVQQKNEYTVLAEPDSVYRRSGISDVGDLIERYGTPGMERDDENSGLYQFAAYHILEGQYFLDAFQGSSNYNTYTTAPVNINGGFYIRINTGVDIFGIEVSGEDTSYINYIEPFYNRSNINTKNGAIHFINEVMEYYTPDLTQRTFQFYEDPLIDEYSRTPGTHEFEDPEAFSKLHWEDADQIEYFVSSSSDMLAWGRGLYKDFVRIEGEFTIEYTLPKVLQGVYLLNIRADANDERNATVEIYMDGKKVGSNFDLSKGGTAASPFKVIEAGTIEFSGYNTHTVTIKSLVPGIFIWDAVILKLP
ncbi:MAG: fasciclin domain-containing protein [Bacteroidetes bacterium]|nr:fasciclin domain-containing protein [Bacteroidota bacterium]